MGAIQSACPVRKTPAVQPAKKMLVPLGSATGRSPSRSTKQFGEASLSKSAEAFVPPGLGPAPASVPATRFTAKQQARQKAAAAASQPTIVNPSDPEWARYLQKKAVEKYGPHDAAQKLNPFSTDSRKATGTAAQGAAATNFALDTSEYLKLLKDGEQKQGVKKTKPLITDGDKLFSKDNSMAGLKNDLASALDSIIKTQQSNQPAGRKKPDAFKMQKGCAGVEGSSELTARIAQMMHKDGAEDSKEPETEVLRTQDDIFCERENRDEDLAVPCYWSDDDQAPRAVRRASAHHATGKVAGVCPRPYVTQKLDDGLDHQVAVLLLHLKRLNERQRTIEPAGSARRRLVVGIKDVSRSMRQGKLKCVVVAPDIEEMGSSAGVDERIREIVCACYSQDTPVVFALSRSRIGKAFSKSLRISAVGILDVAGCNDLYEEVLEQSYAQRVAWLAKQPKPEAPWKAKAAAKAAMKAGTKAL